MAKDAPRCVLLTMMEFGDRVPGPGESKLLPIPSELGRCLVDQAQRRGVPPQALAAEMISNALKNLAA